MHLFVFVDLLRRHPAPASVCMLGASGDSRLAMPSTNTSFQRPPETDTWKIAIYFNRAVAVCLLASGKRQFISAIKPFILTTFIAQVKQIFGFETAHALAMLIHDEQEFDGIALQERDNLNKQLQPRQLPAVEDMHLTMHKKLVNLFKCVFT